MPTDPRAGVEYDALLHALGERVKELGALRSAASMLLHDEPVQDLLQRMAGALPPAMQFPDVTVARVTYGGLEASTANFQATRWTLTSHFVTGDGRTGEVLVGYLEERWPPGTAPFLEEESNLLESLADMLRSHFERRRAEEALRRSESLLRTAGRIARVGAWKVEPPGETVVWSDEVCAIHDVPPGSTPSLEQTIAFYAPEYREKAGRAIDGCLRGGPAFDFEACIVTARGRAIWVRTIGEAVPGADGAPAGLQGAIQDISGRKQAERALRESQERYELAMRGSAAGVWDWNLETQEVYWSPPLKAMLGYGGEEISASVEAFIQALHPEDRESTWGMIERHLRDGTPFQAHIRMRRRSGEYRWYFTSGQALWDAAGRAYRMAGSMVDVTARREAEQEASRLAEQLSNTLESITDAVFTLDRHWRFTFLNREAERQLSRQRESLIGRVIWAEFPESAGTTFEIEARRAVEQQKTVEFEEFFPPRRAWFSVRAYPSGQGGLTAYFQNVTRQREAREEARTSEERFRLLARATNDAIWDWDITTNVLWWNEGFETLFGYRREEIEPTTRSWTGRVHPDERKSVIASLERAISEGADAWTAEYRFRRSDGTYAVVLDRGHIIRDAFGVPVRMIGGMTDVTERRKLEAQFLRAQRLESIGTLAGGIAHDLNNVLTPIVMSVSLLMEDERDPGRLEMLRSIEASAQRGAAMVRQVLAFARGVAGRAAPVNPANLIRDVQQIIRDTFPKDIDLSVEAAPDLWTVQADATQLHQVLMNLCLNARDAMPGGGQLTLSARNVVLDDPGGVAGECGPGPCVLLTVRDTGTGMPREVQDRAFEPFYTTKEVGKGTGLGLSTALSIVKSHGGCLDVQSEPGKGTRVSVYLPVQDTGGAAAPEPAEPRRGASGGDDELILVVDDEEGIRNSTRRMLERFGYRVMLASNGAEAVALYVQHQADVAVVITDMAMPVMDGPATIFALKAIEPDVKIIASSGYTMNDGVSAALSTGVRHFISKPYTAGAMLAALEDLLGKRADGG